MSNKKTKKMPKSIATRIRLFFIILIISAVLFLPTTLIFVIGMMPTVASAIIDRSKGKFLMMSVGILNIAGCMPFIFELWQDGHNIANAIAIALQARTIIIIYLIASLGYVIDFTVAGIVSNILTQQAKTRVKKIDRLQKDLVDRWGMKVTGKIQLDDQGFPIQKDP